MLRATYFGNDTSDCSETWYVLLQHVHLETSTLQKQVLMNNVLKCLYFNVSVIITPHIFMEINTMC